MPMPSREGAGLAIVMLLGREVGATGTLTSKNRSPAKSFNHPCLAVFTQWQNPGSGPDSPNHLASPLR